MDAIRRHEGVGTNARARARSVRPGFTIIELLVGITIIVVLLSMLAVGLRLAGQAGRKTQQLSTVNSLKQAISEFKNKFGFLPPLVRDMDPQGPNAKSVVQSGGRWRVSVRGTGAPDAAFLSADTGAFVVPGNNPFYDPRFSVRTFAYYLAGALEQRFDPALDFPIDGIKGPGAFPPRQDGTFDLPDSLVNPGAGAVARKRTGDTHEPFIDMGRSDPKLRVGADTPGVVPADATDPEAAKIQLVDRNNVAYRYYRWETRRDASGDLINPVPEIVRKWFDRPGRSAAEANPEQLKGARYAIVAAGPDGVFGDEDRAVLAAKVGIADDPLDLAAMRLRTKALEDNVVEVAE